MEVVLTTEDGRTLTYNGVDEVATVDVGEKAFVRLEYCVPDSDSFPEEPYLGSDEELTGNRWVSIDVENAEITQVRPTQRY